MRDGDGGRLIRVALVEDDEEIRETLTALLEEEEGFTVVGSWGECESAIREAPGAKPDVVLMDVRLPGMSGIDGVAKLKPRLPDTDFLMLTIVRDDEMVFRALSAGAVGYLLKDSRPEAIFDAVREVREGGAPMSTGIARMIVRSFRRTPESPLTARETEVLSHLCEGRSYRVIAGALCLSEPTVHFHIKNIYRKLHVHSKAEAVAKALRDKLI